MSFITADGRDYLLGLATGQESAVESYYVALCYSEPGFAVGGNELDEVVAEDYARGEIENVGGNWQVLTGNMTNLVTVGFPLATSDWGLVRSWVLTDDPLGGRALWVGELVPTYISEGDQLDVPTYGLSVYFGDDR